VLLLSELERHVLVERQIAGALIAAGGQDIELPNYAESRAEFEFELTAEPQPESDKAKLLRELGV
jgi:hypothetical protein